MTTRRTLLASLVACSGAVAGCIDRGGEDFEPTGGGTDAEENSGDGGTGSTRPSPLAELPEEGYPGDCPEYVDGPIICYDAVKTNDDVDAGSLPILLEPLTGYDDSSFEFRLTNRSDVAFRSNFYDWRLHKRVDGDWYRVAPAGAVVEPLMEVAPGDSHTWSVSVEQTAIEEGERVQQTTGTDSLVFGGLGSGRYAFGVNGWFRTDGPEDRLALAATVPLDAEPIELAPSNLITEVEILDRRDAQAGDVVVARSESAADGAGDPPTYVLERDVRADDPERVIAEQLVRSPPRRDGVSLAERHRVDTVRLEAYGAGSELLGRGVLGEFRYRGSSYRLTVQGDE